MKKRKTKGEEIKIYKCQKNGCQKYGRYKGKKYYNNKKTKNEFFCFNIEKHGKVISYYQDE